ncbi:MAG: hypothetical protein AAFX99_05740, partial [Myxococcota bacterium]
MESSTPNTLRHTFERWRRRLSLRRGLLRASKVMAAGAVGLGIFILTALVVPIPSGAFRSPSLIGAAWLAITLVLSLIALWLAPFSRRDAATIADLRQDTGALFTTAEDVLCRLERGQPVSSAQRQCLNQASAQAPTLALADVAPMRPSPWWFAALVAVLLGGALPWIPFAVDPQHTLDQQRLNAAAPSAQQLNQQLDELGQHAQLDPATRKQLRRLARRIEEKSITPREALEEIGELKRRLRVERLKARAALWAREASSRALR